MGIRDTLANVRQYFGEALTQARDEVHRETSEREGIDTVGTPAHRADEQPPNLAASPHQAGRDTTHLQHSENSRYWREQTVDHSPKARLMAEYDDILQRCAAAGMDPVETHFADRFRELDEILYGSENQPAHDFGNDGGVSL